MLNEAVENYGPRHEVFIGALIDAPYPVQPIDPATRERAVERLRAVISPVLNEQRGYGLLKGTHKAHHRGQRSDLGVRITETRRHSADPPLKQLEAGAGNITGR